MNDVHVLASCSFLLLLGISAEPTEAQTLPADVQAIVTKADSAVAMVEKTTESQIAKIKAQEIKDLQRMLDAVAKPSSSASTP